MSQWTPCHSHEGGKLIKSLKEKAMWLKVQTARSFVVGTGARAVATGKQNRKKMFEASRTSSGRLVFLDAQLVRVWFWIVYSLRKHLLSAYHVLKCVLVSGLTGLKRPLSFLRGAVGGVGEADTVIHNHAAVRHTTQKFEPVSQQITLNSYKVNVSSATYCFLRDFWVKRKKKSNPWDSRSINSSPYVFTRLFGPVQKGGAGWFAYLRRNSNSFIGGHGLSSHWTQHELGKWTSRITTQLNSLTNESNSLLQVLPGGGICTTCQNEEKWEWASSWLPLGNYICVCVCVQHM